MRGRTIALGCALSLALLAPFAQAQVFKCKDADGKVTYTDVPCLRSETESVVDTRSSSNVADHSSIRKEAPRLQAVPAAPPPAPLQAASPPPAPPELGPRNEPRTSGSYR